MFVLQRFGPICYIWSLELHSDHEGLHRRRPYAACGFEHRAPSEPEGLVCAKDGRAG